MSTIVSAARMISSSCSTTITVLPRSRSFFSTAISRCRVARMQSDARLVEDVERSDQAAAQRRGQIDPLALAAGQRRGEPVEGQVAETDLVEVLRAGCGFRSARARAVLAVAVVEPQSVEKALRARRPAWSPARRCACRLPARRAPPCGAARSARSRGRRSCRCSATA